MVNHPAGVAEQLLDWPALEPRQALPGRVIQLWLVRLERFMQRGFGSLLTRDDLARGDRIRDRGKRHLYLGGRAGLRYLAGHYLGAGAAGLEFGYGKRGKPRLLNAAPEGELKFNYTLSRGYAFYAFAWNIELGVDMEIFPRPVRVEAMTRRLMNEREKQSWRRIPERQRNNAMLRCWTRKEAYGKLLGVGIRYQMNQVALFHGLHRDSWSLGPAGLFRGETYDGPERLHGIQVGLPVEGAAALMYADPAPGDIEVSAARLAA